MPDIKRFGDSVQSRRRKEMVKKGVGEFCNGVTAMLISRVRLAKRPARERILVCVCVVTSPKSWRTRIFRRERKPITRAEQSQLTESGAKMAAAGCRSTIIGGPLDGPDQYGQHNVSLHSSHFPLLPAPTRGVGFSRKGLVREASNLS